MLRTNSHHTGTERSARCTIVSFKDLLRWLAILSGLQSIYIPVQSNNFVFSFFRFLHYYPFGKTFCAFLSLFNDYRELKWNFMSEINKWANQDAIVKIIFNRESITISSFHFNQYLRTLDWNARFIRRKDNFSEPQSW